jgi:hypothetical protein
VRGARRTHVSQTIPTDSRFEQRFAIPRDVVLDLLQAFAGLLRALVGREVEQLKWHLAATVCVLLFLLGGERNLRLARGRRGLGAARGPSRKRDAELDRAAVLEQEPGFALLVLKRLHVLHLSGEERL